MTIRQSLVGISEQQRNTIQAVEDIYKEVCNHDRFSTEDFKRFLKDIKKVHARCKECFKTAMFSWQADRFQLQMYLENTYRFIFAEGKKLTWTEKRWKSTINKELAIYFYRENTMWLYDFQLRLMACWMMMYFFKPDNFTGAHLKTVIDMTFKIVEDIDDKVQEGIREIRLWRQENDSKIHRLNSNRSWWRKEKSRCERLINGQLKATEIELYHMVGICLSEYPYEVNIQRIANSLGCSLAATKRRGLEIGFSEESFRYHMAYSFGECKKRYEKEYRWAKKVLSNTLTREEKKVFWRKFHKINPISYFRTFTLAEPDLIPASNPLETLDDQSGRNRAYDEELFGGVYASYQDSISPLTNPFMLSPLIAKPSLSAINSAPKNSILYKP